MAIAFYIDAENRILTDVDGKIVESWAVHDLLDFYKELGVIEYIGFPKDVS